MLENPHLSVFITLYYIVILTFLVRFLHRKICFKLDLKTPKPLIVELLPRLCQL